MTQPPSIFEDAYYERLHQIEEKHWWALGQRAIMDALLDPAIANLGKPVDLLDVGCGTGFVIGYMQARAPLGRAFGIDISPFALQYCIQSGHHEVLISDAARLPFANEQFDLIISLDTLQHLSPAGAERTAIADMARLLRPGGLLYLRTNADTAHPPLRGQDSNMYRRFKHRQLTDLVTQSGLKVERASYVNMLPSLWGMVKEFWQQRRGVPTLGPALAIAPPSKISFFDSLLLQLLRLEALAVARLGLQLPFGHSLVLFARKDDR